MSCREEEAELLYSRSSTAGPERAELRRDGHRW